MKNKIFILILFCLSLVLIYSDKGNYANFLKLTSGNRYFKSEKYDLAREKYEELLDNKDKDAIQSNIVKSYYEEKNYEKVINEESKEFFLVGNSKVVLGDRLNDSNQENKEFSVIKEYYEEALSDYKNMMLLSGDINIKKNYEIVQKKLEELEEENNQNQQENNEEDEENDQDQNDDSQDSGDDSEDGDSQDSESNDENQDGQDSDSQDSGDDSEDGDSQESDSQDGNSNDENQDGQDSDSQDSGDDSEDGDSQDGDSQEGESDDSDEINQETVENDGQENNMETLASQNQINYAEDVSDERKEEIRALLRRLEGNEGQAFRNNERVMPLGDDRDNNRW